MNTKDLHYGSIIHLCERFSYYGIKSLLLLYLIKEIRVCETETYAIFGVFGTLTYALPFLGGYLADRKLGIEIAIIVSLCFIALGHICFLFAETPIALFFGLSMLAVGAGLYKPNINAYVAKLKVQEGSSKDNDFRTLYIYQNFGAFLAPLICGYFGLHHSWKLGFGIAGSIAVVAFFMSIRLLNPINGSNHLKDILIKNKIVILALMALSLGFSQVLRNANFILDYLLLILTLIILAFCLFSQLRFLKSWHTFLLIVLCFLGIALSGGLISQGSMIFTLFTLKNVNTTLAGFDLPLTIVQSIDPLTVVIGGAFLTFISRYIKTSKQADTQVDTLADTLGFILNLMGGFFLIALSYGFLMAVCHEFSHAGVVPLPALLIGLVLLSFSDLLIYPKILSFISNVIPKNEVGTVMGILVFGMALSQLFGTYLAKQTAMDDTPLDPSTSLSLFETFFAKMSILSLSIAGIFLLTVILIKLKRRGKQS